MNEIFTVAQATHEGYVAPGGRGVHQYQDENGTIWQIHYEPERFYVYRRWNELPAIMQGDFEVVINEEETNE